MIKKNLSKLLPYNSSQYVFVSSNGFSSTTALKPGPLTKQWFKNQMHNCYNYMSKQLNRKSPVAIEPLDAIPYLINSKNILVLTGAGLSASSGIPTFRGSNGIYTQSHYNIKDPIKFLTQSNFKNNPQQMWEMHRDFTVLMRDCSPNEGHRAIQRLQQHSFDQSDHKTMIVTQNVDNFHSQVNQEYNPNDDLLISSIEGQPGFGFSKNVYEIHGNIQYMRCSDECNTKLYRSPSYSQMEDALVPECSDCGSPMKPHAMFFDEFYTQRFNRVREVLEFAYNDMDALLIVGTTLKTGLAKHIVRTARRKIDIPIIEINLKCNLKRGFVLKVDGKSEETLPIIIDNLIQQKNKIQLSDII